MSDGERVALYLMCQANEIEKNKQNNIYTCEVAEVENLLITEEMIRAVAKTMMAPLSAFHTMKSRS